MRRDWFVPAMGVALLLAGCVLAWAVVNKPKPYCPDGTMLHRGKCWIEAPR